MLVDSGQLLLFAPAAIALNLTPGADMLFRPAQRAHSGAQAGVAASLGIATGSLSIDAKAFSVEPVSAGTQV